MTSQIDHPHLPGPVRVRRSARALRMSLKIDPVERVATLVLPSRTSASAGLAFIADHVDWLRSRLAALPPLVPFAPGSVIPLLDHPHRLTPAPDARRGVWIDGDAIMVGGAAEFFSRRVADFLKAEARRQILRIAPPLSEAIERPIKSIRIGDPKSRWGSCNSRGQLAFSWRLILTPAPVLHYVVAHEVAHLREMNHSPHFWRWVAELTPDIEGPRRWLKTHGAELYRYGVS